MTMLWKYMLHTESPEGEYFNSGSEAIFLQLPEKAGPLAQLVRASDS